jgi:hypothetical protein
MKTAVGVVYFPNDGIDKEKTDALFYELLENITINPTHGKVYSIQHYVIKFSMT